MLIRKFDDRDSMIDELFTSCLKYKNGDNGVTSKFISRMLYIDYKSANKLLHRAESRGIVVLRDGMWYRA
jgi:hypothetical protein